MKQRFLICLLCALMVLSLAVPVLASTEPDAHATSGELFRGKKGDEKEDSTTSWKLDGTTLTISFVSGLGKMPDLAAGDYPWAPFKDTITSVVFTGGVTYVGACSFKDYDSLRSVSFGNAMHELGAESFYSCDGLTAISLPESFKVFGPSSLCSCTSLKRIDCAGRFPSFRQNSLWQTNATIYYPAERPWPAGTIANLEAAFHNRITFLASDGTDPYVPPAPTEPKPEPTVAPTKAPTVPTEVLTVPTEPSTQATTQAPSSTAALPVQTTPAPTDEGGQQNVTLWLVLLLIVSIGAAAAAITIHNQSVRRRRRSRRRRPFK